MNFNEKLINLRKSKGLSQEELGNELKVSRQTISMGVMSILSRFSTLSIVKRLFWINIRRISKRY